MTRGRWAVFLDRDGTLVPDARHPTRPEQLSFYPRTGEGLRALAAAGATLAVVSNQSAVARGLLTEAGLRRLDRRLRALAREQGVSLRGAYYCPHHPDFGPPCDCRKPAPGLLLRGLRELRLDPSRCYLVGDTVADLEAARAVGVTPVLVLTGHGRRARAQAAPRGLAAKITRDVATAARWILADRERRAKTGAPAQKG